MGQWPWSRNKVSKILQNLSDSEVAIIGMDVVFAEEDNSSPHKILNELNIKRKHIKNYDELLASTISKTPTILGYLFDLKKSKYINKTAPNVPLIIIEKNKINKNHLLKANGTILNIPILQEKAFSSGFFNVIPDEEGIIRSVPLIISYKDIIYPSLSLEISRLILNSSKIYVNYTKQGIENIRINNLTIPTDRHGRLLVNFRGKAKKFKYYSAHDIYNNKISKNELKDKIVLIGTSAQGLFDLRSTAYDSVFPGVEVHANTIDNIIVGDFLNKPFWIEGLEIFIIFFLSTTITLLVAYSIFILKIIILITSSISIIYLNYIILFKFSIVLNIIFPLFTVILSSIITMILNYFAKIKQEKIIKSKFSSKVSQKVMEELLKNPENKEFKTMKKEVSVFFSDIRNFTKISENINNPLKLVNYINSYMEPMSNIISTSGGTIDKYIGDSIMAYWNAPIDVKNHPNKAVECAIKQIKKLHVINKQLKKENLPLIEIGIGINTGEAIIGEMGSKNRSDYTVIGDSINLASRLESLCKFYGSEINISGYTKNYLKENYPLRLLDIVKVKGKEKEVEVWQVHTEKYTCDLKKELSLYHKALNFYQNKEFSKALELFKLLSKNSSNKKICSIYIDRSENFIKKPHQKFNIVYTHQEK